MTFGFSYRIDVDIFGDSVSFERDEQHNFRAVLSYAELHNAENINKELVKEIANQLTVLFGD